MTIDLEREEDGRRIAEALEIPGVMCYGETRDEAISNVERLAIEVIADRVAHGELPSSASAFPSGFRMSNWPASKAMRVLAALETIGWRVQRQRGSYRLPARPGWPD